MGSAPTYLAAIFPPQHLKFTVTNTWNECLQTQGVQIEVVLMVTTTLERNDAIGSGGDWSKLALKVPAESKGIQTRLF